MKSVKKEEMVALEDVVLAPDGKDPVSSSRKRFNKY